MNTSLLVATCDSYSFLWKNLNTLLSRNLNFDKQIVSCETKAFPYDGYSSVISGNKEWGSRVTEALKQISTEFVFFIFDDYYISKQFSIEHFEKIEKLLSSTEYNKYCMDCTGYNAYSLIPFADNLYIQHQSSQYLTTLQPSVWRVEYLKKILNPNYTPWDFEIFGTKQNSNYNNKIFMELYPEKFYFNVVRRGRMLSEGWESFRIKENLEHLIL